MTPPLDKARGLPELPKSLFVGQTTNQPLYTATQLQEYGQRCIDEAHAAQVEALEAEVARLTAPQDVDLCELASELEKVNEEKVIAEVEALTNGRTDPYWAGFSQACEEIAHRLGVPFKESTPESPT